MENLGEPSPREFPAGGFLNEFKDTLTTKYKDGRGDQRTARNDALNYGALSFAYYSFEDLVDPEYTVHNDEYPSSKSEAKKWQAAVESALAGDDWTLMKEALQSDARAALEGSMAWEGIREQPIATANPKIANEWETQGQSFINLANSL